MHKIKISATPCVMIQWTCRTFKIEIDDDVVNTYDYLHVNINLKSSVKVWTELTLSYIKVHKLAVATMVTILTYNKPILLVMMQTFAKRSYVAIDSKMACNWVPIHVLLKVINTNSCNKYLWLIC